MTMPKFVAFIFPMPLEYYPIFYRQPSKTLLLVFRYQLLGWSSLGNWFSVLQDRQTEPALVVGKQYVFFLQYEPWRLVCPQRALAERSVDGINAVGTDPIWTGKSLEGLRAEVKSGLQHPTKQTNRFSANDAFSPYWGFVISALRLQPRAKTCSYAFASAGKRTVNVAPCPGTPSLVAAICPPCISTMARTIASPKPVPPVARLRARSVR